MSIFHRTLNDGKDGIRRISSLSTSASHPASVATPAPVPVQEIFRRTGHWAQRGDVASDSGNGK